MFDDECGVLEIDDGKCYIFKTPLAKLLFFFGFYKNGKVINNLCLFILYLNTIHAFQFHTEPKLDVFSLIALFLLIYNIVVFNVGILVKTSDFVRINELYKFVYNNHTTKEL